MNGLAKSKDKESRAIVRFRNRSIGQAELDYITAAIQSQRFSKSTELAAAICEEWDWRQANGKLAMGACHDLLLRLAEWGHLKVALPKKRPPTRRGSQKRPVIYQGISADLIPLTWIDVTEGNLNELVVRPVLPEEALGWRLFVGRYHYLGYRPLIGEHIMYAAFLDGEVVAFLGWASAAFRVPAREQYVGWDEETKKRRLCYVANNVRFLIPHWVKVCNLASKVLSLNLKRLSTDWQKKWGHPLYLAETFVDTTRFRAVSYRAANWQYLGHTAGRRKRGNDYLFDSIPKAIYVYPLHRHACSLLRGDRESK